MSNKDYFAAGEGFIDGRWYDKHETVSMSEASAKYHLLQGSILTEKPETKPEETSDAGDAKPNKGGNK